MTVQSDIEQERNALRKAREVQEENIKNISQLFINFNDYAARVSASCENKVDQLQRNITVQYQNVTSQLLKFIASVPTPIVSILICLYLLKLKCCHTSVVLCNFIYYLNSFDK